MKPWVQPPKYWGWWVEEAGDFFSWLELGLSFTIQCAPYHWQSLYSNIQVGNNPCTAVRIFCPAPLLLQANLLLPCLVSLFNYTEYAFRGVFSCLNVPHTHTEVWCGQLPRLLLSVSSPHHRAQVTRFCPLAACSRHQLKGVVGEVSYVVLASHPSLMCILWFTE